ncbi:hypothetical protein ACFO5R_04850 [Halosolutus amylolyticus]|uniref:Uncharacterized protein n=1 Tax=Halosolutus amylolyticus TaxID=2932267 RepID=A0ABD5PLQ2_9EURY|nr:hypothetical protein [Halosolutus amylolyticus]
MNCRFCGAPVQFSQHTMAHRLFELSEPDRKWWLCRDCAEIREQGHKTEGVTGPRGTCIDCDADAEYGISIVKKTPGGDVKTDGTVYQVLCERHVDDRSQ